MPQYTSHTHTSNTSTRHSHPLHSFTHIRNIAHPFNTKNTDNANLYHQTTFKTMPNRQTFRRRISRTTLRRPSGRKKAQRKPRTMPNQPQFVSTDTTCSICLDTITTELGTLDCGHRFCFSCIKKWSKRKKQCPLCKKRFSKIHRGRRNSNPEVIDLTKCTLHIIDLTKDDA